MIEVHYASYRSCLYKRQNPIFTPFECSLYRQFVVVLCSHDTRNDATKNVEVTSFRERHRKWMKKAKCWQRQSADSTISCMASKRTRWKSRKDDNEIKFEKKTIAKNSDKIVLCTRRHQLPNKIYAIWHFENVLMRKTIMFFFFV